MSVPWAFGHWVTAVLLGTPCCTHPLPLSAQIRTVLSAVTKHDPCLIAMFHSVMYSNDYCSFSVAYVVSDCMGTVPILAVAGVFSTDRKLYKGLAVTLPLSMLCMNKRCRYHNFLRYPVQVACGCHHQLWHSCGKPAASGGGGLPQQCPSTAGHS